jgi:aminoglycoside phosphotransferase (APT) family kinase protein
MDLTMVFHPREPRVLAVLDWELSTFGHPLADFAYHLMMYRMPPLVTERLVEPDLAALNIPSGAEYVAAYCGRTRRADIPSPDFYVAFNRFRLAGIFHGIKARVARGTAASAHAKEMVAAMPVLAECVWSPAQRVTP